MGYEIKISVKKEEPTHIWTYDELLRPYFLSFEYFANVMDKSLDEVRKYFLGRNDVVIRDEYVRKNVDIDFNKRY